MTTSGCCVGISWLLSATNCLQWVESRANSACGWWTQRIFLRLCVLRRNLGRDIVLSRRREHHQRAIAEISGGSHLCRAQRGENLIIDYGELMFGRKRQELFFLAECSWPEVRRIAVCCQASPAKMKLKEGPSSPVACGNCFSSRAICRLLHGSAPESPPIS